jgi:hypothetical protein
MAYAYVVAGLFWLAMGIFKRIVSVSLAETPLKRGVFVCENNLTAHIGVKYLYGN